MKLRLTITVEYDADPEYYGTDNAQKMAEVDQENFDSDPNTLIELLNDVEYEVKVEPA